MMIPNMHLAKVGGVQQQTQHENANLRKAETSTSFRDILDSQLPTQPVQFSKHAALRLNDRNINLTGEQISRVSNGIGKADEKGIRDSLVLVDDVALVVNVKSRTVITAIPQLQENIFTNIDGAVVV
jgi:flagellar operon protein